MSLRLSTPNSDRSRARKASSSMLGSCLRAISTLRYRPRRIVCLSTATTLLLGYGDIIHGNKLHFSAQAYSHKPDTFISQHGRRSGPGPVIVGPAVYLPADGNTRGIGNIWGRGLQVTEGVLRRKAGQTVLVKKTWSAVIRIQPAPGKAYPIAAFRPAV